MHDGSSYMHYIHCTKKPLLPTDSLMDMLSTSNTSRQSNSKLILAFQVRGHIENNNNVLVYY